MKCRVVLQRIKTAQTNGTRSRREVTEGGMERKGERERQREREREREGWMERKKEGKLTYWKKRY